MAVRPVWSRTTNIFVCFQSETRIKYPEIYIKTRIRHCIYIIIIIENIVPCFVTQPVAEYLAIFLVFLVLLVCIFKLISCILIRCASCSDNPFNRGDKILKSISINNYIAICRG